jgi:hypothetical protein
VRFGLHQGQLTQVPDAESESQLSSTSPSVRFDHDRSTHGAQTKQSQDGSNSTVCIPSHITKHRRVTARKRSLSKALRPTDQEPPEKRMKSNCMQGDSLTPRDFSTVVHSLSLMGGCSWSSVDWSCAYDTIFMVLFHIYVAAPVGWKECWKFQVTIGSLAEGFDDLSLNVSNLSSQVLFNHHRDRFSDLLHAADSVQFPRFGMVGCSVIAILECILPSRTFIKTGFCSDDCHSLNSTSSSPTTAFIPVPIECSRICHEDMTNGLTLQHWLDLWLEKECHHTDCPTCAGRVLWGIHLVAPPPILFFEQLSVPLIEPL